MPNPNPTQTTESSAAELALSQAREFAGLYGNKQRIVDAYEVVTGEPIRNEEITRILTTKSENHIAAPRLGRALLLMAICSALQAGCKTPSKIKSHVKSKIKQYAN